MSSRISYLGIALVATLTAATVAGACGTVDGDGTGASSQGAAAGDGGNGNGGTGVGGLVISTGGEGGGEQQGFDVQPSALQTLDDTIGQQTPTVRYTATLDGQPVAVGWGVDRGNIGTVPGGPSTSALFTPSGTTGGTVEALARLNNQTLERSILVRLSGEQNGADPSNPLEQQQIASDVPSLTSGGGIGGVGGEGLGPAVADGATLSGLATPASNGTAEGLKLLYPYDGTVWPRGLLAPLLQWDSTLGDVDAIQIELSTTTSSFSWKGTFGRPDILTQTGKPFVRHPIPQDIWQMATNGAGGADKLTVRLTVAKGGVGYGPIGEVCTIAPARLSGVIYYQSYGTKLAKNYPGAVGGDGMFGGAVLSIHGGDTGPALVAGSNGGTAQCRVCHSVAADGSRLVVQHGDAYGATSAYDLTPNGGLLPACPGAARGQRAGLLGARPVQARGRGLRDRRRVLRRLLPVRGPRRRPAVLQPAPRTNCSEPQELCGTAADCCDPTNLCINGFCAQQGPA